MFPSCSHCFTYFRTIFVFALGPFLPMVVVFSALMGISMGKWPKSGHPSAIFGSPQNAPNGSFWMFWAIFLRKGPRAKTKIVLKSVSKVDQLGSMHNLKFQTFLNKNPPSAWLVLGEWIREAHIRGGAHFRRWSQARPTVPHFHPSLPHTIQPQLCILGIKRKAHDLLRRIIRIHFI